MVTTIDGDITPQTDLGRAITSITMLVGASCCPHRNYHLRNDCAVGQEPTG
ncbi:potassium channel family protein [Nitrosospira multiformis]|uniref:potassium channel family protein n=1 Tax=Nitrosospira multiformis TaxID=1231 RepID=UPI0021599B25|nr:potassium channel family protein [Nitrosospira multiformis]